MPKLTHEAYMALQRKRGGHQTDDDFLQLIAEDCRLYDTGKYAAAEAIEAIASWAL